MKKYDASEKRRTNARFATIHFAQTTARWVVIVPRVAASLRFAGMNTTRTSAGSVEDSMQTLDQKVIHAINLITGDDFCEVLDCEAAFRPEKLTATEKTAHEKLSLIYRLAHSHDKSCVCYERHKDWRALLETIKDDVA